MSIGTPGKPSKEELKRAIKAAIETAFPGCEVRAMPVGLGVHFPPVVKDPSFVVGVNNYQTYKKAVVAAVSKKSVK